jgi:polar amino acid transport system substrate-binding protein
MRKLVWLATVLLFSAVVAPPALASATLDRILQEKKIKVGVVPGWPRFIVWDPKNNRYEGFLADDIRNFEESTGIKIEFVTTNWNGIIAGLQAGNYDVIMGGISPTPERSPAAAFSEPYAFFYTCALVRPDSTAGGFKDLDQAGKTVTAVSGTAMHKYALRRFKNAKVAAFTDSATAVLEVMQGRADAYVGDSFTNYVRAKERPSELKMVKFDGAATEWGGMSHAVRYADIDVLSLLNTYIGAMKLRNWYADLTAKHDLPPETPFGPAR